MEQITETTDNLRSQGWRKKGEITRAQSTDQALVNSPDNMIMVALTSGRSMEEIKELIKLRNEEIARLAELEFREAKKEFQRMCPPIVRNSEVDYPHKEDPRNPGRAGKTNFWYADLDAIIDKIKEPLAFCGLSYDWKTGKTVDGEIEVTCILAHIGGHKEIDTQSAPADASGGKSVIHARSSTQTYLKRQTLSNVCGISPGAKDDNGNYGASYEGKTDGRSATEEEFKATLKGIMAGKTTLEEAEKYFRFSNEQKNSLKIAQNPNQVP